MPDVDYLIDDEKVSNFTEKINFVYLTQHNRLLAIKIVQHFQEKK